MTIFSETELETIAKEQIGEDKTAVKNDIAAIKLWIRKSPHLKNIKQDDETLLRFLRGCKFSLERTKEKLEFYNACKSNLASWFDWDAQSKLFQKMLNAGIFLPLPGYDKKGRKVVLMRQCLVDPNKMSLEDIVTSNTAFLEFIAEGDDQAQIMGLVLINDLANTTAGQAKLFNPVTAKKAITLFQEAYPSRPKGMHFVNMTDVMMVVFNMFQQFQKEKMKQRNKIHKRGDYSELVAEMGEDVLPVEYGGNNGTCQEIHEEWVDRVVKNKDWFKQQINFKSDEFLRPGKPKSHAELFGIEGSFRKLEID